MNLGPAERDLVRAGIGSAPAGTDFGPAEMDAEPAGTDFGPVGMDFEEVEIVFAGEVEIVFAEAAEIVLGQAGTDLPEMDLPEEEVAKPFAAAGARGRLKR
jgi:hypothetical protein